MEKNNQEKIMVPSDAVDRQARLRSLGNELGQTLADLAKDGMDTSTASDFIIKNLDAGFQELFPTLALFNLYFSSNNAVFGLRHEDDGDGFKATVGKAISPEDLLNIIPVTACAIFELKKDRLPDTLGDFVDKELLAEHGVDISASDDKAHTTAALVMMLLELAKEEVAHDLKKATDASGEEAM